MNRLSRALAAAGALALRPPIAYAQRLEFAPVTDEMLRQPADADWLMWRRTLNGWGYSPLRQITTSNVTKLRLVWSHALEPGLQETTPLEYRGTLYVAHPHDVIEALDATTGERIWEYRRELPADFKANIPRRNIAIYDRLIISSSDDDFIFALDAMTGRLVWETRVVDYHTGAAQSSGPIIANGRIISGRQCRPEGGPDTCVITAHDARTGKELWRTRTIPREGEPGSETWGEVPAEKRVHVGTWMPPSYDPTLDLIYFGTSETSPAPKFMLGGNDKTYLYHNSTLAIDAKTGRIVWHYQHLVDNWDIDHTFERLLIDTRVAPDPASVTWINPTLKRDERREVVTGIPGKTGVVYTLDRKTGEFLWARPTVTQNLVSAIDGKTGAVTTNPAMFFNAVGDERLVCPSSHGGKDWQAGAYSPLTGTMYFPLQNTCMKTTAILPQTRPDSLYAIKREFQLSPNATNLGTIYAISVETGATRWIYEQRAATSSLVATGGGLLFGGGSDGHFRAIDQQTGKALWEMSLDEPVAGFPIVFAVGGREYVAVSTGRSVHTGVFLGLTNNQRRSTGSKLFVFALPDE